MIADRRHPTVTELSCDMETLRIQNAGAGDRNER